MTSWLSPTCQKWPYLCQNCRFYCQLTAWKLTDVFPVTVTEVQFTSQLRHKAVICEKGQCQNLRQKWRKTAKQARSTGNAILLRILRQSRTIVFYGPQRRQKRKHTKKHWNELSCASKTAQLCSIHVKATRQTPFAERAQGDKDTIFFTRSQ